MLVDYIVLSIVVVLSPVQMQVASVFVIPQLFFDPGRDESNHYETETKGLSLLSAPPQVTLTTTPT